ncbi:ATP-binding protein [Geotalea sp. SG265]|uniref:ATP-binding protein n=1 Tax=Geotalea sp. SG265 TaxID=2922867 RepID=UPI001FAE79E6|nr:ATP-binding protein [Geotalea sp. SG265]
MANNAPFSQENLNEIFKISTTKPDRVISRECGWLEFKESFGWASIGKYLRSCAGFANAKGGYIVFGIANSPHKLLGLKGKNLEYFEAIDPEQMSKNFNDHFAPEIEWDMNQYELEGNVYGLLYIYESRNKPVVCCKDAGKELKEGDIYYRYRGRTERIKYPDLRIILETRREQEQQLWMQHLSTIARIGVRESGIFDLQTGLVTGAAGSFLIDESLLSQLCFIKEGEFSEVKGKPALKLIGDLRTIGSFSSSADKKQIVKTKGIRVGDIVGSFLTEGPLTEPQEYIRQICFEETAFLPVYYYMSLAGLNGEKTIEVLKDVVSRSKSKSKLIERVSNSSTQSLPLPKTDTPTAKKKRDYAGQLLSNSVNSSLSEKNLEYCLQSVRGLSPQEVSDNSSYLRNLLRTWFNKYYASAHGTLADNLRRAICWVDEALYKEGVRPIASSATSRRARRRS